MSARRFDVYAPVTIPTLCRYEHFKRCIDSLKKCTGAEYTDVYIGIDYPSKESHWDGYNKICEYVNELDGFNKLVVFKREKNFGAKKNMVALRNYVRDLYDRCIVSEDDNEFAPNFLEYMNECLTRFKDNQDVIRVCGSKMPWAKEDVMRETMKGYGKNAFPAKDFNASGVAIWFDKYYSIPYTKKIVLDSWSLTYKAFKKGHCSAISRMLFQLKKESQLPDVCLRLYCAFHDKYCIFPSISKVKNWGYDGSGLNSDNNLSLIEIQELDSNNSFVLDDIEIKDYPDINVFVKKMHSDGAVLRSVVMFKYLYYRITKGNLGESRIYKWMKKLVSKEDK